MIIGTAGHIDHGKTALVRALTGVDTDRLPEEKRRGITIDLGFAPLSVDGELIAGIVDVPGHEAFVRTMIAGASGIDLALVVVAADEGVMPQTREHLAILNLLGVRSGVVAITKSDLVDAEWLELVRGDVATALRGTGLESMPIIAVSAQTGTGVDDLRTALADAVRRVPQRREADLFRMPIDRAFSVKGTGTVVTGTVWSGRVEDGMTLLLLPSRSPVRVRGVQTHGQSVSRSERATRTAIALVGVEVADVRRGSWLVGGGSWPVSLVMRAEVALLPEAAPLRPREWVRLHLGTSDVAARVVAGGGPLAPGARRVVRLILTEPVAARALDRFVLRRASPVATIGGGIIIDPLPAHRRPRPWPLDVLEPERRLHLMLEEASVVGLPQDVLPLRLGLSPSEVANLLDRAGGIARSGGNVYSADAAGHAAEQILTAVARYHQGHPLEVGMPLPELRGTGFGGALLDSELARLGSEGKLEVTGTLVRQPGWEPTLSPDHARVRAGLLEAIQKGGAEPPDVATLEQSHPESRDVRALLRHLEREGLVMAVEPDRYYAAEVVRRLVSQLRAGMTERREYSPTELREALGLSRKYLIPFLEFCDRKRITERRSTGRVLLDA